jgi:hypothetical protein
MKANEGCKKGLIMKKMKMKMKILICFLAIAIFLVIGIYFVGFSGKD